MLFVKFNFQEMADDEMMIITRVQKGDTDSFAILYDRYIKKIYDFIYFKTHHKETAEDLTSFVFMKALNKIASYRNQGQFSSWLYRIARNTVIDHYRSLKQDVNIEDVWDLSDDTDINLDIDVKNKLQEVKKHLSLLSATQRDIILMRLWQGMSYREIAAIVGKSEGNCKMIFSRVLKNMRHDIISALLLLFLTTP